MKVAITGSRGFIGSHLKTRLEKDGHEVIEWDLRQEPPQCIKDFDPKDCSYVIHLAAYADVRKSLKEPDLYYVTIITYLYFMHHLHVFITGGCRHTAQVNK